MTLGAQLSEILRKAFADELVPGLTITTPIVVTWTSGASYNPATQGMTGGTTQSVSAAGIQKSFNYGEIARAGGLIEVGDRKVILRAAEFTDSGLPPSGAVVTAGGQVHKLVAVPEVLLLDGVTELLLLHCRRGSG